MKQFVHLFQMGELIAMFDTTTRKWKRNCFSLGTHALILTDLHYYDLLDESGTAWVANCNAYQSNYPDLLKAKFVRNRDGEIALSDRPAPLSPAEFIDTVTTTPRKITETQLRNLRKLTPEQRYQKPKVVTDSVLETAKQLRADGLTWTAVADKIGVSANALKVAHHRQQATVEEICQNCVPVILVTT